MPRVTPRVPELSEVLCSSCGYVLNGLVHTGVCPECGKPIVDSLGDDRKPPAWETAEDSHRLMGFIRTTMRVILRPAQFYRTLNVRGSIEAARSFAKIHWLITAGLFGVTAATHAVSPSGLGAFPDFPDFPGGPWALFAFLAVLLSALTYVGLDLITRLASRLTTWEATYRGIRLPYNIVLRGMFYHAAHYLPVALAAMIVVEGYPLLWRFFSQSLPALPMIYLYVLCGLVIVSAIYLFQTYWIGMRNMMYANR